MSDVGALADEQNRARQQAARLAIAQLENDQAARAAVFDEIAARDPGVRDDAVVRLVLVIVGEWMTIAQTPALTRDGLLEGIRGFLLNQAKGAPDA